MTSSSQEVIIIMIPLFDSVHSRCHCIFLTFNIYNHIETLAIPTAHI